METKGMKLNKSKIKIIAVSRNKNINSLHLKIKGILIKKVKEYKYLDGKIVQGGRCKYEAEGLYKLKRYFNK